MKKVLSLVLVIAMVLSSMSFAFAAKFEDVTGDYEKAVDALVALGVVSGYEDGTFRPEKTITRAELAKLLVEALGYGNLVAGASSTYSDVQGHWANGYVAIASGTNLVVGYPNGTFQPDKAVTYDEALTMVVRALGYTDAALKGTWPTNFKVKAIDLKLTKDVVMSSANADRGGVAQILYNALEAVLVTVDADNKITNVKDAEDENVILLSKLAKYNKAYPVDTNTVNPDSKKYGGNLVDLEQYMYQNLKVYLNDDDEVVYVKGTNSLVAEGTVDKVTETDGDTTVHVKEADGTIVKVVFDAAKDTNVSDAIFQNGETFVGNVKYEDLTKVETIKIVATDAGTEDGKIQEGEVKGFVLTQQTKVDVIEKAYKAERTFIDGFELPVDSDGDVDLEKVTVTGAVDSLEDIEVDDVVVEYAALDSEDDVIKTKLVVSRDTVEGKVTRLVADKTTEFYIDGVKYKVSTTVGSTDKVFGLGDEGTFMLDHNGKIVAFEGVSAVPTDYALVVGVENGSLVEKFGKVSIDTYPQVKIATQDNELVVLDVFVKLATDGTIKETAVDYDDEDLVAITNDDELSFTEFMPTGLEEEVVLIKYSVNEDGQLDAIEVVDTDEVDVADTTKSTFKMADGAIIFNLGDDDYEVVDVDQLAKTVTGTGVYNKYGLLEVLLTEDIDDVVSDTVYAYVDSYADAYNKDGDKVQVVTVYVNGDEKDLYTDGTPKFTSTGIYELELDGDLIVDFTKDTTFAYATVDAISTSNNRIKLDGVWYAVADNALILEVVDSEFEIADLYDIDENDNVEYELNDDNEVVYIGFEIEPEV